ncbi:unnamed protein product [Rhizophagus irregularis]|uniref:Uncharacterized protein n=1 Tax=Rhizophagus irregularis TaxID=588596 RepID=A0A2N1MYF7_9GLOM|nr:hypothetical protein RhiirC2_784516 [Rhizophagus irregularis]CAB4376279.1 unnamed protein product [Rhizophagus irregularis]
MSTSVFSENCASDSDLVEFLDTGSYHHGTRLENIGSYQYKFRDDSIRPRRFFGTDDEDGINAILTDCERHSLHEIIDGDDPLCPFIDFDLLQNVFNSLQPKHTSKEIRENLL